MRVVEVWGKITLVLVSLKQFKRVCEFHGVEVLEVEKLGGLFFRQYRVKLRGTLNALHEIENY